MNLKLKHKTLAILLTTIIWLAVSPHAWAQSEVPGVVVDHSHASSQVYLGSPSIVILEDGAYVASHDFFGPGTNNREQGRTAIFRSTDRGQTWKQVAELKDALWSNLFTFRGALYLMGTNKVYGDLVIRKSLDGGRSWTKPENKNTGLLRTDKQYHTAPMPMVIHNGRIIRAIEDRHPPEGWGVNFRAMVISAPIGADLLKASNWSASNRLRYDQDWPGRAWLEGNVLVMPEGDMVNVLRNDYRPEGGRACIVQVSKYGDQVSFDTDSGFIDFPGGCKKFSIRYDGVSGRYWSLSNYIPPEYEGHNPERTRNTLALISSKDLRNWEVNKIILQHPDVEHVGFQYADWQFDGEDMVALIRTAYPEPDGTKAHSCHDANYTIFYRIKNFRKYTEDIRNK